MRAPVVHAHPSLRLRLLSALVATLVVGAACVLLVLSSAQRGAFDTNVRGIEVMIAETPRPAPPDSPRPDRRQAAPAPARVAPRPTFDAALLQRALACLNHAREARPSNCPPQAPPPPDWNRRAQLPVGGDFAGPEPLDLESAFTIAERQTLLMPPCGSGCIRVGPRPPPPSRTAEAICEAGGLGPCHPPPFDPERAPNRQ